MNVRNCRSCGCIFNYISGPMTCPACRDKLEKKFAEVKDYIRENKGVGIKEVAEACDVDPGQIRQWLREERLELAVDSGYQLSCESCGEFIRSGRFCEKCTAKMARGLQEAMRAGKKETAKPAKNDSEGPKMRFFK